MKRGMLYSFSLLRVALIIEIRELGAGCQGLEGRIMRSYSLMNLEFQF